MGVVVVFTPMAGPVAGSKVRPERDAIEWGSVPSGKGS
jgi:hypothetical protein